MLFVDTDPAAGIPFRDVDDVLALHLLVSAGEPVTVTTVYGNASGARTHAMARELGDRWGIPVFRGADRPGQQDTAAVDALVAHKGSVLGIGPCTNLAAALARGARWERLVLLGGTERRGPNVRYLRSTELNFALDLPAARRAMEACTTLFPMEVCRKVRFTASELPMLPPWLQERVRGWLRLGPWMTGGPGFHPWDVLPALWLLEPAIFVTERRGPRLRPGRLERGALHFGAGAVEVVTDVEPARFLAAWRARLHMGGETNRPRSWDGVS